jgi:phosphoglycolate phosphatase-like HAD superfamily hydrolase
MLRAVLFDLDDTLYEQATWLTGAWDAVVAAAAPHVEARSLRAALRAICAQPWAAAPDAVTAIDGLLQLPAATRG